MSEPACQPTRRALFEETRTGEFSPEVERHLETCVACQALAAQVRDYIETQRALAERPLPAGLEERVLSRLGDDIRAAASAAAARLPWWRSWRPLWVASGLAAAAALLVLVLPRSPAELVTSGGRHLGTVSRRAKGGSAPVAFSQGTALSTGDLLAAGEGARAELLLGSDRAMVMPEATVELASLAPADVVLRLTAGAVVVEVEPGRARTRRFRVLTPQAEVQVTGTLFRVATSSDGTRVDVAHGSVVVRAPGRPEVTVRPGQSAHVGSGASQVASAEPGVARELTLAFELDASAPPLPLVKIAATPSPTPVAPEAAGEPPPARVRPIRRAQPPARGAVGPGPGAALEPLLDAGSCALAEQGLQSLTAAPAELQAERGIDVADCFYAEGNHRRALARYEDVAQRFSSTPAAANATYESGRVAALLGEHRQAQMWFDAYLVRFPSGPLAGEALFRRCSLLPLLQMRSQALTCLQEYRSRFPGGSRTATTHYQEATLLREDADCPGALRAYARYLEHPGPLAAQAREWAAWCQRSPLHDAGE